MFYILIVEDNHLLRQVYQKALVKTFGDRVQVDSAKNGKEAVTKIQQGSPCDIIVMDIDMPVMNGVRAAQEIRALGFTKPIVAHTSLGIVEAKTPIGNGYMDGFIIKSGGTKSLLALIRTYTSLK